MILDLEGGVAYTSFLKGLKIRQFKFSLAEQKEIALVEDLRKATGSIRIVEVCAESTDASKKAKIPADRNAE